MKTCPDGRHCQNEYLIEDLEQEVAIRTVEYDEMKAKCDSLTAELTALREQVANLKMSKTHKARVQAVKHMLEQTSFIRKCFSLDVFRNYPRLRDEGLKILDGELDNEEMK